MHPPKGTVSSRSIVPHRSVSSVYITWSDNSFLLDHLLAGLPLVLPISNRTVVASTNNSPDCAFLVL